MPPTMMSESVPWDCHITARTRTSTVTPDGRSKQSMFTKSEHFPNTISAKRKMRNFKAAKTNSYASHLMLPSNMAFNSDNKTLLKNSSSTHMGQGASQHHGFVGVEDSTYKRTIDDGWKKDVCDDKEETEYPSLLNNISIGPITSPVSLTKSDAVDAVSFSSSSSVVHDNIFMNKKQGTLQKEALFHSHGGKSAGAWGSWGLASRWSRCVLGGRRKYRPSMADTVLIFMLFLAMLHLSW